MKTQIRPASGQSFCYLMDVSWKALTCMEPVDPDCQWVEWQTRTWLCKRRNNSISEIVGYQIAEALDLPLQPWVAFFQTPKGGVLTPGNGAGILVERWKQYAGEVSLCDPAETHPELVSRALAIAVLDRQEFSGWLHNKDKTELRLFDLEFIGPVLRWPPRTTDIRDYLEITGEILSEVFKMANEIGVFELVEKYLKELCTIDFSQTIDFSGLPYAEIVEQAIIRALQSRQSQLRHILISCGYQI